MTLLGTLVLVRTVSAGVHFGNLEARNGGEATITDARRIWSWKGANTLSEIATKGVEGGSRISQPVPWILLIGVIEIIPISAEASTSLVSQW